MREIKFRGLLKSGDGWSEGNLNITKRGTAIISPDETVIGKYGQVDPETVGQYTGLSDKKAKEIYEGDYCIDEDNVVYEVRYVQHFCGFYLSREDDDFGGNMVKALTSVTAMGLEVIGNIWENPELLKAGDINEI